MHRAGYTINMAQSTTEACMHIIKYAALRFHYLLAKTLVDDDKKFITYTEFVKTAGNLMPAQ